MIISADWVLPVVQNPIREGAVRVEGTRIAEVGTLADLASRWPDDERHHFAGHAITPGLVNAHTHLTLTALAGAVPPAPFTEWLPELVAAMKPWTIADHEASGALGARQCLAAGVTAVGDIAYGAAEVRSASDLGLGGVYYWELLGLHASDVERVLEELRYPSTPGAYGERVVCGLSPHAPYSCGPDLLRAIHDLAENTGVPFAIHVAESDAETQLLRDGTGALAATAQRTAFGFRPPNVSSVRYLHGLGVLDGATAVHCCHADAGDIELIAAEARGVVTCPRSNTYLGNPVPDVPAMLAAGIAVGIGTDSSASNWDLDLMADVRALGEAHPALTPGMLLEIATAGGARAIGLETRYGGLGPGLLADLAVFAVDGGSDPERCVLENAGAATLSALMAGGEWRVREGELL